MLPRRTPAGRALVCALAATTLLPAAAHAAAVRPTDDVSSGAAGAAKRLVVSHRPSSRAFVRFNLRAPPRPRFRAILSVYSYSSALGGLVLRHASDGGWTERALGRPLTGPRSVRSGPLRRNRWTRVDVTHLVNTSGVVSLALASGGGDRVGLARREARGRGPRVEIRYAPPARPTGSASSLAPELAAPAPSAVADAAPPAAAAGSAAVVAPPSPPVPPAPPSPSPPPPDPAPAPAPAPAPTPDKPCGVAASPPAWQHIVWIVMENHSYGSVMGTASTPYTTSLAQQCGVATNFSAESRPSLPNYIAMTSGDPQGITDDNPPSSHPLDVPNLFQQVGDWRTLAEAMPSNCALTSSGRYAVKHNPAAYYTNIRSACQTLNVPLGSTPDLSAKFTFLEPDMCNSTHDCSVQTGDAWLQRTISQVLDSAEYRSGDTALFLTYDEGSGDQHIATVVVSPSTPAGTSVGTAWNHYSMVRTTEEMFGLPVVLGKAVSAQSMRSAFNL